MPYMASIKFNLYPMGYIITLVIIITLFSLIRAMNRTSGWYEVIDQNNQSKTFGKFKDCKNWIQAQKGMDSLIGVRNNYKIKRKKF